MSKLRHSAENKPDLTTGSASVTGVLQNKRLSDQIYELLLGNLRSGDFGLDTVLTEPALAKALNTSRTPVREALFRLTSNGVLVEQDRGYRLPVLSQDDVAKLIAVRSMIELEILRLVADRISEQDLTELKTCLSREQEAVSEPKLKEFIIANNDFRAALFACCDNSYLVELADMSNDRMQAYRIKTLADPDNRKAVASAHARVTDQLENGDGSGAVTAYEELMQSMAAAYTG